MHVLALQATLQRHKERMSESPGVLYVCQGARHARSHRGDAAGIKWRCQDLPICSDKTINRLHNAGSAAAKYFS